LETLSVYQKIEELEKQGIRLSVAESVVVVYYGIICV
jgi:hypothetical protein